VVRLVKEYVGIDSEELKVSVHKIAKRLGSSSEKICIESIEKGDFSEAISLVLNYYDKAYTKGLSKREPESIYSLPVDSTDIPASAQQVIKFAENKLSGLLFGM
ncbi:MAG: hypothetical protein U9R19_14640, partial [Bacteroidota bacterium]|nr:hypothetical protein [Bacteroidota bacterium]